MLKRVLTYKPLILRDAEKPLQAAPQQLQLEPLEVDCPDCYDTMIKIYDSK